MHGSSSTQESLFPGIPGPVAAMMRGHDWSASPLGDPATWPQSLRLVVDMMLSSKFPMFVAWGPELGFLYNDAYAEILASKHPAALGRRFHEVWHEIWDDIHPLIEAAMAGEATYRENLPLTMNRKGFDEETWFTFSYSPVRDEHGTVAGMFCAVAETTKTVLAERALRDSERRLRLAVEGARMGTWDWDLRTLRGTWSPRTMEILGAASGEGVTPEQRNASIHPDDRQRVWAQYLTALESGAELTSEYRAVRPNGEVRWIVSRGAVERDDDGVPVRTAGIVLDVTENKTAEAALRESEARFRQLADAVPEIVWIFDPKGQPEFYNQQWSDYTGADPAEMLKPGAGSIFVHPDDQPATMTAFRRALATGTTFEVENRLRSRAGDYRWFLARAQPYRDPESGEILRWFGVAVDIHDQKLAENRLREINDSLEAQVAARSAERQHLWNLSQDMLARADYQGMMSAVSPAWGQVLGWSEAELLSRGYATFMHPEDMPQTLAALAQMGETGQPTRFENRIATSGGGYKPIEWLVTPEEGGENFIAVGRDLSLSKAREAELAATQEALRQSQKLEAIGSLTGGVAHDFNNLLTPIIGSLDMLVRRGLGSERERQLIDGALQSAERAQTLVQRLLAFARRQPLQPTAVDMRTLVEGMVELIHSTVGPAIELKLDLAPGLPPANADPNQLEMALLNLAVNARDAMPNGGVLRIEATLDDCAAALDTDIQPGQYLAIRVRDTGTGMDEETRQRAIEPFFSTKGIGKGTGLGLSMVHGLAAQLGGGLAIDSALGAGTSVTLWLPTSDAAATSPAQPTASVVQSHDRGIAMLVDDEILVRMSTADMLGELGFEVREFNSAEAALDALQQGTVPAVLLTDQLMAGMSGIELARAARGIYPDLPVLIVSGYAEGDGGAQDLPRLVKPFRKAELEAAIGALSA